MILRNFIIEKKKNLQSTTHNLFILLRERSLISLNTTREISYKY